MAQPDTASSVTLRDYFNVIWLRKWLVVILVVACTVTAYLVADSKTRIYEATALIMYRQPANIANPLGTGTSTDAYGTQPAGPERREHDQQPGGEQPGGRAARASRARRTWLHRDRDHPAAGRVYRQYGVGRRRV